MRFLQGGKKMSIGIIVNSACVLIGGLLGSFFGRLLPVKMRESLYGLFGYCSIIIGIILLQNIKSMPAVTLALILGTIIGEALRIEDQINFASLRLKTLIERITKLRQQIMMLISAVSSAC